MVTPIRSLFVLAALLSMLPSALGGCTDRDPAPLVPLADAGPGGDSIPQRPPVAGGDGGGSQDEDASALDPGDGGPLELDGGSIDLDGGGLPDGGGGALDLDGGGGALDLDGGDPFA